MNEQPVNYSQCIVALIPNSNKALTLSDLNDNQLRREVYRQSGLLVEIFRAYEFGSLTDLDNAINNAKEQSKVKSVEEYLKENPQ